MEFSLQISRDNSTGSYVDVDLFPQQQLDYDLDFYDSLEIDKVKLPFYTTLRIPLTETNKASNRFNFDPLTSLSIDYPKDDFYFKITVYGSSSVEIAGILNVKSFEYNSSESYIEVELKDYLSKYLTGIKELKLGTLYGDSSSYYRNRHTFSTFTNPWNDPVNPGEAGIIGTNPEPSRPISFPYIDFCNDVDGKFGYAARQFLEYGPGLLRTGIMPVFSVPKFFEYIGLYINDPVNFPVRVDSKLFALGDYASSPAFPDFQPEKLHMVIPSQLLAKQDVNTRNFFVRQAPAWTGTNFSHESDEYQAGGDKYITTGYFGNMETAGNYGTDGEGNPLYGIQDWGAEKRMGFYPDDNDEGIRGFFCPKVSFNAGISLQGGSGLLTIAEAKLEIPIIYEDKLVDRIYSLSASSTMTFKIYIGIYEDGMMKKKIPLIDSVGGNDIILTMSDVANVVTGNSNKDTDFGGALSGYDYFDTRNLQGAIIGPGAIFYDTLLFNPIEAYFPRDEELFINMGSRYSVNYFIEPLDGELDIRYVESYTGSNPIVADVFSQSTFGVNDIKKAITRIDNYGPLNVVFTSNQDTFLYKDDDEFSIEDSINQTCPLNVSDILPAILKRFDCGLFYEYDANDSQHVLRIDPLSIVRSGSQDVNQFVDDLKSVVISNGGDKVKSLEINNKDYGLYFDDLNNDGITIGSTTQQINNEGIAELKIDLESSIYYRSVCGEDASDYFDTENLGAYSEKELGFTTNIFTPNKDVGLRFAYLDKPLYKTNLLIPYATLAGFRADNKMKTESEIIYSNSQVGLALPNIGGQHVFNGRLFHYNTAGWNLMFEDGGLATQSYSNIFEVSEKILQSENPRIEFDMVVPTPDLASLNFFLQTLSATRFTANPILIKSAKGEVFEDYAYLTIEGILQ